MGRRTLLSFLVTGLAAALLVGWWSAPLFLPPASYSVRATLHRKQGGGAELLAPGARVAPGDEIFMELESSRDLFVYVVTEDERGEQYLLFPLPGLRPANPLPRGGPHRLPGTSNGEQGYWQVTSAGGREHFLIVASPKALQEFEAVVATLARPQPGVLAAHLSGEAALRLRGIGGLTTDGTGAGAPRIPELAPQGALSEESARGVWMRRISLENPAR